MAEKKSYEIAVENFEAAETHYRDLEERFLNGEAVLDLIALNPDPSMIRQGYLALVQELHDAIEERNVRRKEAAEALRAAVVLAPGKWRGPDGKPETLTQGRFAVTSVTSRGFDQKSLFDLVHNKGLLERLLDVKTVDKKTGKERKIVEQTYAIDYAGVLTWLKQNKLQDVIDGAYDESESTPQVKGPKEIAFLGENKKD